METRKGLVSKLLLFSGIAITLGYLGKRRASNHRSGKLLELTETSVDKDEFEHEYRFRGKPVEEGKYQRTNQFIGAGNSYSSRKPGDRLTMFKIFDRD